MEAEMLRTMFDYSDWAMTRIFDAADGLTQEQLDTPGTAGHGSIRQTLLHLIDTQRGWLSWWDGSMTAAEAISSGLDLADYPDVASLRALWEDVSAQTAEFTSTLKDEDATRVYSSATPDGRTITFILWQMMYHVANHGTLHRSEVAAMLTDFGHSPGNLDPLYYFFEQPGTVS
jgi:uncharacterized damage-inducible protein DinB